MAACVCARIHCADVAEERDLVRKIEAQSLQTHGDRRTDLDLDPPAEHASPLGKSSEQFARAKRAYTQGRVQSKKENTNTGRSAL